MLIKYVTKTIYILINDSYNAYFSNIIYNYAR